MELNKGLELKQDFNIQAADTAMQAQPSLKQLLAKASYKARFEEILGQKAAGFISSLVSVANSSTDLSQADPQSIIAAGVIAATLDLPINPNLGFAYIIPRGGKYEQETGYKRATFQMGYKGYIQLAMRSGQYKAINACEVYEGEIEKFHRIEGTFEFGEKKSNKIIGYMAYFKLISGGEKYLYMSMEEMQAHALKYSGGNYKGGTKKWGITDFNSMAIKTVLKKLLSTYGILSISMQPMATALSSDGGVINQDDDGNLTAEFEGETIEAEVQDALPEASE